MKTMLETEVRSPSQKASPQPVRPLLERLDTVTREDLAHLESTVAGRALQAAIDDEAKPVALYFRGRVIMAQPLNTRRFVRAIAPYLCFN